MHDQNKPVMRAIALALLTAWSTAGYGAGLGPLRVHSALGHPLRASVLLSGEETADIAGNCIKGRLESAEGVFLVGAQIGLRRTAQGTEIQLATHQNINEPALSLQLDVACGMQLRRTYQLLLDPVVILPQVAQTERQPAREARVSRPAPVAIAPPQVGASADASRPPRKKVRKSEPAKAAAPARDTGSVDTAKMAVSRELSQKTEMRSVLRLSSDEGTPEGAAFAPGLRMSNELSESRDTGDPAQMAELRAAQQRFAAIARGEDPAQAKEQEIKAIQSRLDALARENEQFKLQDREIQAEMEGMRRDMFSGRWIAWLLLLLASAFGAVVWLALRLRDAPRRRTAPFWEDGDERRQDTAGRAAMQDADTGVHGHDEFDDDEELSTDWAKGLSLDDALALEQATKESAAQQQPKQDVAVPAAAKLASVKVSASTAATPLTETVAEPASAPAAASQVQPAPKAPAPAVAKPAAAAPESSTQVEEISDLMQEAEFWMLLNDAARAIDILEPYSRVEQPVSPVPWIYLLDLYRVTNQRPEYEALKARIKQVFNTNAPEWGAAAVKEHNLLDYPHLADRIRELWESDDIVPFLESLLVDDRDGAREGFDLSVYREIIHLISVAHEPDIFKRRAQLHIGKSQPRLLSQHVTADGPVSLAGEAEPEGTDIFDRATSSQATAKQMMTPKPAVFKAPGKADAPAQESAAKGKPAPAQAQAIPVPVVTASVAPVPASAAPAPVKAAPIAPAISLPELPPVSVAATAAPVAHTASDTEEHVLEWAEDEQADDDIFTDMATKLELAVAYQEIGEHVGARVLLEEVIQGGSEIQVDKAKTMLKKLLKEIDWQ